MWTGSNLAPDAPMNIHVYNIHTNIQYIFIYIHCMYTGRRSIYQ